MVLCNRLSIYTATELNCFTICKNINFEHQSKVVTRKTNKILSNGCKRMTVHIAETAVTSYLLSRLSFFWAKDLKKVLVAALKKLSVLK